MPEKQQEEVQKEHNTPSINMGRAIVGGIVSTIVALIGVIIVNVSSGSEARALVEGMLPSIRFLCSAVMTATATILALMLTMLSVSRGGEGKFKPSHYNRVQKIALIDTITFAGAIILLLFVSIPLSQSDSVPTSYYKILYYIVLGYAAALGGTLISIILMLYNAITDMVQVVHPTHESHLLMHQEPHGNE